MFVVSRFIWIISLALGLVSVLISYRRRMWNRHFNLVLCIMLTVSLLLCVFYGPILSFLRRHMSQSAFLALRGFLKAVLFAHSGIYAALQTLSFALSLLAIFVTVATGCSALLRAAEEEHLWVSRGDGFRAVPTETVQAEFKALYLDYCSLLM